MTSRPTIGITGATGFIGSALAKHLAASGYSVIRFMRDVPSEAGVDTRKYDLTDADSSRDLFNDIDVLIHCAFVTKAQHADAEHVNYCGTKLLVESCRQQGVSKIIFFSSLTADQHARSAYAKGKFAIHRLLNLDKDLIIRCSLVIGEGGLFGRILRYATSHRFIPVIGSGKQMIQFVVIEDLEKFVAKAIVNQRTGMCALASPERVAYKQLFSTIATVYRRKTFFIPVPIMMLKVLLKASSILHIQTPVSEENLLGFQTIRPHDQLDSLPAPITLTNKLKSMHHNQHELPKIKRKDARNYPDE